MRVRTVPLTYWKEENGKAGCEDALDYNTERGLFAVADGVGTTSFSNIWAQTLVHHFLAVPLLSVDPFEVEWWLREAKRLFETLSPPPDSLGAVFRRKALLGSQSTFASMRIKSTGSSSATAQLLAIGDSCLLLHRHGDRSLDSFPLGPDHNFNEHPDILPTRGFSRTSHCPKAVDITVHVGDRIILATDAVAAWILVAGLTDLDDNVALFDRIANLTPENWPAFIRRARKSGMVEDDSTALVIQLFPDAPNGGGEDGTTELGATVSLNEATLRARQDAFRRAVAAGDNIQAAVLLGDPDCSQLDDPTFDLPRARSLADGFAHILSGAQTHLPGQPDVVRELYNKFGSGLEHEPIAQPLIATLAKHGIVPHDASVPSSVQPTKARTQTPISAQDEAALVARPERTAAHFAQGPLVRPLQPETPSAALARNALTSVAPPERAADSAGIVGAQHKDAGDPSPLAPDDKASTAVPERSVGLTTDGPPRQADRRGGDSETQKDHSLGPERPLKDPRSVRDDLNTLPDAQIEAQLTSDLAAARAEVQRLRDRAEKAEHEVTTNTFHARSVIEPLKEEIRELRRHTLFLENEQRGTRFTSTPGASPTVPIATETVA